MVFESVVVELLNRYLKPYVKKLDTSQLKVGVWKGHARLDKLELKEDLFAEANLDVPLKIKRSFIGNLEMTIPWKKLTKDTLQITIDEMYVILGPDFELEYDPERDLKRKRKEKEKKIEDFEEVAKKKKQKEKEAKKGKKKKDKDSEKPDTFVEKLVVHMTKNLQVKVRDIHVRYEDSVTNPPNTAAAGITLHSLELKSTDADWAPCVVRETATLIYKLVELNCLGVYWTNCAAPLASPDLTMKEMIEKMRGDIARPVMGLPPSNAYLLQPMSATAKLKLNLKAGIDLSLPQMLMGVECEDIMFTLRKEQLAAVLHTVESFDKQSLNRKYLKYKPVSQVREDLGGWWRYAITAVLEEDVKRRTQMWSWKHIKQHRETCRLYQQKYREKLHSLNVSSSLLAEIQSLEDSLDWFNIIVCRRQASKKEKQKSKKGLSPSPSYQTVSKVQQLPSPTTPPSPSTPSLLSPTSPQASFDPSRRLVESKSKSQKKKELKEKEKEEKKGKKKGFFSKLKKKLKHSDDSGKQFKQKEDHGFVLVDSEEKEGTISEGAVALGTGSDQKAEQQPWQDDAPASPVDEEDSKEKQEFYQAIGYVEGEEFIEYPKEYVAHEVHVTLKTVSVELIGAKQLGTLVTKNISANIYNRPSNKSVSVDASVGSLSMSGVPGTDNSPTTLVTSNVEVGVVKDAPLVEFQLEMNPLLRPELDVMVKAALRPIQITYDFETVNGLIDMFKPPQLLHFQELTQAASATWDQLKSQTTASLQEALKNRKQLEVDVTLQSPYLLVPEKGRYSKNSNLLVVDLGKLSLFGSTKDPRSITPSAQTADNLDSFYDSFTIKLIGMQVLVAEPGMNWSVAMSTGSSPLHILDPTGFEIQLLKSIVKDDAYLPSLRVEGTIPGFEVKISDKKLATLVKVGSSLEKPPALITKTTIYDNLPAPHTERHVMDNISTVADIDTISLDSSVMGSYIGDDEDAETCSLSTLQQQPTKDDDYDKEKGDTAQFVFTDVSIKLTIKEIALKLTQTEGSAQNVTRQKPILDVVISNLRADVVDRKWDTQGNIMMEDVAVLDHITPDSSGQPTYLLKTQHFNDGNFISARFVTLTKVGIDFAHKYTGLENTVAAQVSLVKLTLNQRSVTTLLHYFMALKPVLASPSPVEDVEFGQLEPISELEPISTFNPKDVQEAAPKDLSFDVQFVGVDVDMIQDSMKILQAGVTGFIVTGKVQADKTSINASVRDISVKDPTPNPKVHQIITRSDWDKDILYLNVVQFNKHAHQRDPHDMSWVDTSLKMEANRINVNLSPPFLTNVLGFVKKLNFNSETFQSAAKASAGTAAATATAIADSMKTAHRLQLDFTLHAPIVFIPFKTKLSEGGFYIDLGDFHVSNQFKHGHELLAKDSNYESMSVKGGRTILDCMDIHTSSVQIFRKSHANGEKDEKHSIILEPLQFTALVIRNIGIPTGSLPSVDVSLELQTVKFHIHEEDVQALVQTGLSLAKLGEIMSPPPKQPGTRTRTTIRKKNVSLLSSKSVDLGRQRSRTRTVSRLRRSRTISHEDVTSVRVKATISSVSFDLTTTKAPLLKATASGLNSEASVINEEVTVCGSVDSLSVEDLGQDAAHSKVVSLAADTNKVSSLRLTIFLNKERDHKAPIGKIKANIAQMLLIVNVPFVLQLLGFVQRIDIDRSFLKNATKAAQDGAIAVSSVTQDKYFKIDVTVHAPVLVVPLTDQMEQGLMVDLGSVNIENTLLVPDPSSNVAIDAYGVKLDSFKVSRVLLDFNKAGSPVIAERVLLQPFHMLLAVERNLCPWYTSVPTVAINLNMGELKIFLGQEDLESFASFGKGVGEKVTNMIAKMKESNAVDASADFDHHSDLGYDEVLSPLSETPEYTEESFDKLMIISSLSLFHLKVFTGEPTLDPEDKYSQDLTKLQDFALASLQLVTMEMKMKLQSNENVEVQASMKDIALCDEQKQRQSRNTGNRVIQHYTSNPLHAYTGVLDKPIVSINYLLRDNQHIVLFSSENLLVLSDVEFLSAVANYFKSIAETVLKPTEPAAVKDDGGKSADLEETLTAEDKKSVAYQVLQKPKDKIKKTVAKKKQSLPRLKLEGSIKDLRVSLVEAVDEPRPQALTLKVSTYVHFQLTETSKQASLNVVDLGVATSSFFDLDSVTSWVLFPCSLMVSMTGPLDGTAMDINGTLEPVSLKLSPAVVRLIIHAAQTLIPDEEPVRVAAPRDLWEKKLLHESNLWFFAPVPLHKAVTSADDSESKNETITLSIESVEVILESESTSRSVGHPLLAVNVTGVIQVFDFTGNLSVDGTVHCEASYYNEHLSLWEPVLEPLEDREGRQHLWEINLAVTKTPPKELQSSGSDTYEQQKPQFTLALTSKSPLQITLTKTSLQLIKTLAEAYTKEYGKQVEGSANLQSLTGAPFTVVNRLGKEVPLCIQPGAQLKFKDKKEFVRLSYETSVDLLYKRDVRKRSYASLVAKRQSEVFAIDIAVGTKFRPLKNVVIDTPAHYYYTLVPKDSESLTTYGLVVDVAVTGTKKTITVRSPIQIHNHLLVDVDLLTVYPQKASKSPVPLQTIKPDGVYPVPIDVAQSNEFYVRPSGFAYEPEGPPIMWLGRKDSDYLHFKSVLPGDDSACHYIRVDFKEEKYKVRRNIPTEDYAHHIIHLYPPLVFQNLLPFEIFIDSMESGSPSRSVEPGQYIHVHDLDLEQMPHVTISVVRQHESSLKGKFRLSKKPKEYLNFVVAAAGSTSIELTVHTENLGYLKMGVFCPFWMVNKTDLTLKYKEGPSVVNHPPDKGIQLFSTSNSKSKIQLGAITDRSTHTDWTKSFTLNAVGTSGNFGAKLGETSYRFGVEVRLSQFTLTKLVIVTPYFLLVNETEFHLKIHEDGLPGNITSIPPGELSPFWPLTDSTKLILVAGEGEDQSSSAPFNYRRSDHTVLRFDGNNEVVAVCVEIQESESATIVTFSPYYPGCAPVYIINHFPDMTLKFAQDTKSPLAIAHTLSAREIVQFTWDDPSGRKVIKWDFSGAKVQNGKPVDISKDSQGKFLLKFAAAPSSNGFGGASIMRNGSKSSFSSASVSTPPPIRGIADDWLAVDESLSETLVPGGEEEDEDSISEIEQSSPSMSLSSASITSRGSLSSTRSLSGAGGYRGYWMSFIDGLQRVLIFTPDEGVIQHIKAVNSYSVPLFEVSLSLRAVGVSLVDNDKKRELAYIAVQQSGVIWQVDKGKKIWKTLNNTVITILEEAYQSKKIDLKQKNLVVNLETMEMYSPVKGRLRRTHHDGVFVKFALSEQDYSLQAKVGHVQVDNQLPFSVYPQVLYPLPPPPTVASTTEPKPFVEASVILRKNDQSNVKHFKYVHVLVQKMAVNVDLGFILALVDFFSLSGADSHIETEYVKRDIEYVGMSLKETIIPELSDDFNISRNFFDVLHLSPIKVTLSFNIRSVGKNKSEDEITVGDRFLQLFLHSVGVILTSVQETEMKFSCFHLEYQPQTGRGLKNLLIKHYRTQGLFQLHTLIFGLDVLGNPVSVVRGVVEGAVDLFYEPFKGSVLGPEEFFEGLGIGLKSFFAAGVVGGLTGAGARITGAIGDVWAKLTFDDEFIDRRQQQKTRPPKMGLKLGGFAKNFFEGVTGIVTQPVRGLQKEGAVGLLKGTGRGLVGLLVRPTGGLVDLASGTLDFVTRKTQVGNVEISDIRPPRFIARDGVIAPYSPSKALGTALLVALDEGKYVESDYYFGHVQISTKPLQFVLITDRHFMRIERRVLTEGWKSINSIPLHGLAMPVEIKDVNVIIHYKPDFKEKKLHFLTLQSEELTKEVKSVINGSYYAFLGEQ